MIRLGIVGCGRILNAHLQGFLKLRQKGIDGFRIAALAARRESDAEMFRTRGHGPPPRPPVLPAETGDPLAAPHTYVSDIQEGSPAHIFTDYRKLIESGLVDAVLDTSTLSLHHQVGIAALDAGLHLLTQKPLAITVRAARAMVERARARGLVLGTFENVRQSTSVRAARWAFETGLLGKAQMAVLGSVGGVWSPNRIVAQTPWRHDKLQAGGGGSIDIGVHQMHLVRYILGEVREVRAVTRTFESQRVWQEEDGSLTKAHANVDDTYFASVTTENDALAQLLWSWAGHGAPFTLTNGPAYFGSHGCIQGDTLYLDGQDPEPLMARFLRELDARARARFYPAGLDDPYAILQHDWLSAITTGNDLETNGEEGLRDLAAAMAICEAAAARRAVTLDEVLTGAVDAYQREIDEHWGLLEASS